MKKLLTDKSDWEKITKWINDGLSYDVNITSIDGAFAVERNNEIVAASTLLNSNGVNAYIQLRVLNSRGLTREFIKKTFHHAFVTLGLKRISSNIVGNNIKSIKVTQNFGFVLEGILRGITENGEDIYLSVMRPENCRFLEVCDAK